MQKEDANVHPAGVRAAQIAFAELGFWQRLLPTQIMELPQLAAIAGLVASASPAVAMTDAAVI